MKGFKHTGKGPRYGSFTFPSKAGFGPSSGRVKSVSGYTRRAPKRVAKMAIGGLTPDGIVDTPGGPADFKLGGKAKRRMGYKEGGLAKLKKVTGAQITEAEAARVREKMGRKTTGAQITSKESTKVKEKMERMGYAEGGKVSAAEAKRIAQGVVKDHVNYPAPKGHKGFNRKAVIGN